MSQKQYHFEIIFYPEGDKTFAAETKYVNTSRSFIQI